MTVSTENLIVGVSVTREFVEYCVRRETGMVLNSTEFFAGIVERARQADPDPAFVVEAAGGWESGIVRAIQTARLRVAVVESAAIEGHFGLAGTDAVDALAVCLYGEQMRGGLQPAGHVTRVISAFGTRPRTRKSAWQRVQAWLQKARR